MKQQIAKALLSVALIFSSLLAATPASSQSWAAVQVQNFQALPQEQSNWCWAASMQALFLTKGLQVKQSAIVTAAYGAPLNKTAPGFDGSLQLLNALVLSIDGTPWKITAGAGGTYPAAPWLLQKLRANEPVMIWYRDEYTNHSIVINGGTYFTDNYGRFQGWRTITAYDPYTNRDLTISAENIPRYVYGTFDVSVKRVKK